MESLNGRPRASSAGERFISRFRFFGIVEGPSQHCQCLLNHSYPLCKSRSKDLTAASALPFD